jgi:hypothetical protein
MNDEKLDELRVEVRKHCIDVVGIAESWTRDGITDAEISLEGFTLFRRDRVSDCKMRGGGVLLYVRNELQAVRAVEEGVGEAETVWVNLSRADRGGDKYRGMLQEPYSLCSGGGEFMAGDLAFCEWRLRSHGGF